MPTKLFDTKDVLKTFSWISQQTLHLRIKSDFLPIQHRSNVRGKPNQFTEAELVQAQVVDCLSEFGILNAKKEDVGASCIGPSLLKIDPSLIHPYEMLIKRPFDLRTIEPFYRCSDYKVWVFVQVEHIPQHIEGKDLVVPGHKKFSVSYVEGEEPDAMMRFSEWLKSSTYGTKHVLGIISVRRIFEDADWKLGLR